MVSNRGLGKKDPLLLLHGRPGFPSYYFDRLVALADERPVIFYDQLGCGRSDRPKDPSLWTLQRFVAELADLLTRAVGTSVEEELHVSTAASFPGSWSPAGDLLAAYEFNPETQGDIWMIPVPGEPRPWLATDADEIMPRFSPDGRFVAYTSNETGRYEVFVQPFPGPGARVAVSGAGEEPVWSSATRELFFRRGDAVMAVRYQTEPSFRPGRPVELFRGPFQSSLDPGTVGTTYGATPDGEHFVMLEKRPDVGLGSELDVIFDWAQTLSGAVPGN